MFGAAMQHIHHTKDEHSISKQELHAVLLQNLKDIGIADDLCKSKVTLKKIACILIK
jgi:hypothetical protein